jgi:hypothetical protein
VSEEQRDIHKFGANNGDPRTEGGVMVVSSKGGRRKKKKSKKGKPVLKPGTAA